MMKSERVFVSAVLKKARKSIDLDGVSQCRGKDSFLSYMARYAKNWTDLEDKKREAKFYDPEFDELVMRRENNAKFTDRELCSCMSDCSERRLVRKGSGYEIVRR